MKAMITVMAVGCCAATALAALTSRSYVQDGLIAQYDGINNVGTISRMIRMPRHGLTSPATATTARSTPP